ncbi:MAG: hypothetical protein WA989_14655, partial [Henriciella sp.]|uniref:hypothetical protein n=1 Tax=Henriciella sp. TaxID=1968823 RepID=UPI003C749D33
MLNAVAETVRGARLFTPCLLAALVAACSVSGYEPPEAEIATSQSLTTPGTSGKPDTPRGQPGQ